MNRLIQNRFAGLLLAVAVFAVFIGSVGRMGFRLRKGDPIAPTSRLYLTAGGDEPSGKPLFAFRRGAGSDVFVPEPAGLKPVAVDGGTGQLSSGSRSVLAIGRYLYDFQLRSRSGGFLIHWELVGARMRVGQEIGRNPSFYAKQILAWERAVTVPLVEQDDPISFWMDAMPLRAFKLKSPASCGNAAAACLEWLGPNSHATIERSDQSVQHIRRGESVGLGRDDWLWVGHVPYRIVPPGTPEGDFEIRVDIESQRNRHGDRGGLGSFGFHGDAPVDGDVIVIYPLSDRFKTGHLSDRRWEPETEDELQLLIDHGLLCLTLEGQAGTGIPVPKLVWGNSDGRACQDSMSLGPSIDPPGLPKGAIDYSLRAKSRQQLLNRANASLRFYAQAMPDDFPFVFEWWPVQTADGLGRVPVRLWGVRTGTTNRQLDPPPGKVDDEVASSERPVLLRGRGGAEVVLAETRAGGRTYTRDLLGLGPLLGVRDRVEGLDNLLKSLPNETPGESFELTIDPDLQASLWDVLKGLSAPDDTAPRARENGISAVVMNARTGDLLSVLNFPEGLQWELHRSNVRPVESGVPMAASATAARCVICG